MTEFICVPPGRGSGGSEEERERRFSVEASVPSGPEEEQILGADLGVAWEGGGEAG